MDQSAGGDPEGVSWITLSDSEYIQNEFKEGKIKDQYMAVPKTKNANPYSQDLVTDYWDSTRRLVKERLLPKAA